MEAATLSIDPPQASEKPAEQTDRHRAANPWQRQAELELIVTIPIILVGRRQFSHLIGLRFEDGLTLR